MLTLGVTTTNGLATRRYTGRITNVSWGRISDYRVELVDFEGRLQGEGKLDGWPRWSEPVAALVARCIEDGRRDPEFDDDAALQTTVIEICLGSRTLLLAKALMTPDRAFLDGSRRQFLEPRAATPTVWEVAQPRLAAAAYGRVELPPAPTTVFEAPVYRHVDVPFCRISDLPATELRCAFEKHMDHKTCPVVPGVPLGDAVYVRDLRQFLGE